MESGIKLSAAKRYGRLHGTAFYFDRTFNDDVAFLKFMSGRLGETRFPDFLEGFNEAKDGRFKKQHRNLRGLKNAEFGCACEMFLERAAICEDDEKARNELCSNKCKEAVPL